MAYDGYVKKSKINTLGKIATLGFGQGNAASSKQLGEWFRKSYKGDLNDKAAAYLNSIDDATLGALMEQYYDDTGSNWLFDTSELSVQDIINDLNAMKNVQIGPSLETYLGDYVNQADEAINKENEEVLALYDKNLARQTDAYNAEMNNLNRTYNDYARNIMGMNYQNNAMLMGTVQQNLDKSRRNALEAGANAGLRIASNVNTLLSAQNKQAATSLETSNQLAQAMVNQRNAAAGIRGDYNNMLSNDTSARANLKSGSYERKLNAQNSLYNNKLNEYNTQQQINTERNGNYTSNPFYDSYTTYKKANNY